MKTTLVLALLGLLACSVPTSAKQSNLRDRLVRQADRGTCSLQCSGDLSGNVVIVQGNLYIVISRHEENRFILAINIERQVALYLNLSERLAAIINIKNGGSIVYEIDTGIAFYLKLSSIAEIDFTVEVDAQVLYNLSVQIHIQIMANVKTDVFHFHFFGLIVDIAAGVEINVILKANVEVAASIEADLGGILTAISKTGTNAIAVVKAVVEYVITVRDYVQVFINIAVRLPARVSDEFVTMLVQAFRKGGAAVKDVAKYISGAVSALGDVVIERAREWTLNVRNNITYVITAAREALRKFWSVIIVPVGDISGALEIGFVRNFIFVYNKKNDWVVVIGGGRMGIFNMVQGTGIVIQGNYIAMVYRNAEIREKWAYFLDTLIVPTLQAGLGQAFNVTIKTKVERQLTLREFEKDVRAGSTSRISAEFLADFEFYANYLRQDKGNSGAGVCFSGFRLGKFATAFINVITRISRLSNVIFVRVPNLLFDAIYAISNFELGFDFNFSFSG